MNQLTPVIIISVVSVVVAIAAVYLIVKINRGVTSKEIQKISDDIHVGIGKIDLLMDDLKKTNEIFDLNGKSKHP